jgi:hypothetical protein
MEETDNFIFNEKERLLRKYNCHTIEELLQKLQQLLSLKQKN